MNSSLNVIQIHICRGTDYKTVYFGLVVVLKIKVRQKRLSMKVLFKGQTHSIP
jgi:hypothetical protein